MAKLEIHYSRGITAGEAAALIDAKLAQREASREASKNEAATPKQLWYIKHNLGYDVDASITKGAAQRIIAEAKERMCSV
jgi:hypothetical protein